MRYILFVLLLALGIEPGAAAVDGGRAWAVYQVSNTGVATLTLGWDAYVAPPAGTTPMPLPPDGFIVEIGPVDCSAWTSTFEVPGRDVAQYTLPSSVDLSQPMCLALKAYAADPNSAGSRLLSADSNTVIWAGNQVPPPDPRCDVLGDRHVGVFVTDWMATTGQPGSKGRVNFQLSSPNSPITQVWAHLGSESLGQVVTGTDVTAISGIWFTVPTTSGSYALTVDASNAYGCRTVQTKDATGAAMAVVVK